MMKFLAILLVLIIVGAVLVSVAFDRRVKRLKGKVERLEGQLERLKSRYGRDP
jgi:NADH:ubiquinone oxidoreductase subunit 6 (subunit J)